MTTTRSVPNRCSGPAFPCRDTDTQAQHSEDSVLPSPALTNEPSPADTTRNASPNVAIGILSSGNQEHQQGDDVFAIADRRLEPGDSLAQPQPRTSAQRDSQTRETTPAQKRVMARLAADAEAERSKRARLGLGVDASQPTADGQSLDQWIDKINARVELSGGWQSIGNDLDTLRYQYLKQACQVGDTFYVILHQLLCIWSTRQQAASDALPNVPPATVNRAMELLQIILRSNHTLSPQHLKWFGSFPMLTFDHISQIRDEIGQFLEAFAHQWQAMLDWVQKRQMPLTASELINVLKCGSKTLQGALFTVSRRTLQITDDVAAALNGLFGDDQHNEKVIAGMNQTEAEANASRCQFTTRYQALVAQARQAITPNSGKLCSSIDTGQANDSTNYSIRSSAQRNQPAVIPSQSHLLQAPAQYNMAQLQMQTAPPMQGYQPSQPFPSPGGPSGQQGETFQRGPPRLAVSTPGTAGMGHQQHAASSGSPLQFPTRDQANAGFPSRPVPHHGPHGQILNANMWNQDARAQNQRFPNHAGGTVSSSGEMVATAPRQISPQYQAHSDIQQPLQTSTYPSPVFYQPQRYPNQQLHHPLQLAHPHAQYHPHNQQNAGSPVANVAVPNRTSVRTTTPGHQAGPQRRPQQILPHEYPRSPYDWKSVESGAHLPQLRSPKRQPLGVVLPTSRHYQYLSSFVVRPTHLPPAMGLRRLEFTLSKVDIEKTSKRVRGPNGLPVSHYSDGSRRYRLRLCVRPEDETEVKDCAWAVSLSHWPPEFYPSINNQPLLVPRKQHFHHDLPIELSDYIVEGKNVVSLSFPKRARNFQKQMTFFIAVEVVVTSRHEALLGMVHRLGPISRAETVEKISRRLKLLDSDDVIVEDKTLSISVTDPFTSVMFEVPVRGLNCKHMECFDLGVWLMTREGKPSAVKGQEPSLADSWNCPICGQDARPNMLQIDGYMAQVRSQLLAMGKENTKTIQVAADGNWEPVIELEESADNGEEEEEDDGARNAYRPPAAADVVEILDD